MNAKNNLRCRNAFTLAELLVVVGVSAFLVMLVLPALARTRANDSSTQCQNNLKQLAAAWAMYSADNGGSLVSAYPSFGGFNGSWCKGNAASNGGAGSYIYGGADPAGITSGLLWPYVKTLGLYKCPEDNRLAPAGAPFAGQPILRSISMNSYMAGMSYGVTPSFSITSPGPRNPNTPVFLKENEISRPSSIFVILEEDPQSINDCAFLVDMGGAGRGFIDLPSRLHSNGYGINFADGHTEQITLTEPTSLNWTVPPAMAINDDWRRLTNITTAPLK